MSSKPLASGSLSDAPTTAPYYGLVSDVPWWLVPYVPIVGSTAAGAFLPPVARIPGAIAGAAVLSASTNELAKRTDGSPGALLLPAAVAAAAGAKVAPKGWGVLGALFAVAPLAVGGALAWRKQKARAAAGETVTPTDALPESPTHFIRKVSLPVR